MAEMGKLNTLEVLRESDHGVYLQGENSNDILLPNKYVPEDLKVGDEIEVFIHRDSEDRIIATTLTPKGMVGEFAHLEVVAVNRVGAFMDWGLEKDLFVPFKEQRVKMQKGDKYVVGIYIDESTDRIAASSKLYQFLDGETPEFSTNEEVEAFIYDENEIGYNCLVNERFVGIIYESDVITNVEIGQKVKAYVQKVRPDNKVDLSLLPSGYGKVDDIASGILKQLQQNNGYLALSDKSPSETINLKLGISKKNFKKAIGSLYKKKLIEIEKIGIRLTESGKAY
ncbi:MAG: GntR family transcriptional regulator [Marinilabiliales bacterium]|nr:MAG: GntR family transcriptional regulator [Marinilabiliales bacterium]